MNQSRRKFTSSIKSILLCGLPLLPNASVALPRHDSVPPPLTQIQSPNYTDLNSPDPRVADSVAFKLSTMYHFDGEKVPLDLIKECDIYLERYSRRETPKPQSGQVMDWEGFYMGLHHKPLSVALRLGSPSPANSSYALQFCLSPELPTTIKNQSLILLKRADKGRGLAKLLDAIAAEKEPAALESSLEITELWINSVSSLDDVLPKYHERTLAICRESDNQMRDIYISRMTLRTDVKPGTLALFEKFLREFPEYGEEPLGAIISSPEARNSRQELLIEVFHNTSQTDIARATALNGISNIDRVDRKVLQELFKGAKERVQQLVMEHVLSKKESFTKEEIKWFIRKSRYDYVRGEFVSTQTQDLPD